MADPTISGASPEKDGEILAGPGVTRKDKRKALKKLKRKQVRRELAAKEREEEEARSNDPEEQLRIRIREQEEAEIAVRERKAFEERERLWLEAATARKAEEEATKKLLEESQHEKNKEKEQAAELEDDEEWEYVEEGPVEIIWQGNEIIVKKKRVKVPKKSADRRPIKEDDDRPTSNPLPPQSAAYTAYQKEASISAQEVLEKVAQQTPNFGTEQDKAHCPFHLKTGACRFGSRCSRVHFYPDKSCTLLIKNLYNGPGLAWEQDEGLEYTDEEVERCYEEFYEDVHTEFLKFGELINFKVCRNGSYHLRGNVYVHYRSLDSAGLAYNNINGRYFAGKQISCEFIGVTRWKVAICGEYMKSRLKTCSRGTACNFIHCFRNPGGDYEWADWDNPPPKYWIRKMDSLFGHVSESGYDKQMELQDYGRHSKTKRTPTDNRSGTRRSTDEIMRDRDGSLSPSYQLNSHFIRREHSRSRKEAAILGKHKRSAEVDNSDVKHDYLSSSSSEDISRRRDRGSHRKYPSYEERNNSYYSKRHERKHRQTEEDLQRQKGGNRRSKLASYKSKYRGIQKEEVRSSDYDSDFTDDPRDPRKSPSSYNSGGRPSIDEDLYSGRYLSDNLGLEKDPNSVNESRQNDQFGEKREHDQYKPTHETIYSSRDYGSNCASSRSRKQKATECRGDSDDSGDNGKTTNSDMNFENSHGYSLSSRSNRSTGKHNKSGRKRKHQDDYEKNDKNLAASDSDSLELSSREHKRHSRSRSHHQSLRSSRRKDDHNSSFDS